MHAVNSLENVVANMIKNKESFKSIPFMKIDSLKIYYDIKLEGMYVIKLHTNSNYLKENQFILDYFHDFHDLIDYVKNHYNDHIKLVEDKLLKEIAETKIYINDHCLAFKDILKTLNKGRGLFYELTLEACSLKLEKPNLKYDIKTRKLDLYDDDRLISSRYNIYRKR